MVKRMPLKNLFSHKANSKSPSGATSRPTKPVNQRFLSDRGRDFETYIQRAKDYPQAIGMNDYMYAKPFGELSYYSLLMYNLINLLKVMDLPPHSRILEVGSGPGWVTEILVGLRYRVDSIEPAEDFLVVARERVAQFIKHHHIAHAPEVRFHAATLEECDLPDDSFDGILFFDALHHIVDEERGFAQCMRLLRQDGVLAISEAAWIPGDEHLESKLKDEMARYGTLENPFTPEYLDYLLEQNGFVAITRYHQIDGLFPVEHGGTPIIALAQMRAEGNNTLTARKPVIFEPNTLDPEAETTSKIEITHQTFDRIASKLTLDLKLTNTGKTAWLSTPRTSGGVTVALYRGEIGSDTFDEAQPRQYISRYVLPGDSLELRLVYNLPSDYAQGVWKIDMVNEGFFWFSNRGTETCVVNIP